jgi:putative oxidoreductase
MASGWIKWLVSPRPRLPELSLLVLRAGFGLSMALGHGLPKLSQLSGFTANVAQMGFPLPAVFGPAAALSELFGGLLLALGLFTRAAAASVLITMLVAAFWVHANDPFQKKELAFAYALVALFFVFYGPGKRSVDAAIA